MSTCVRPKSDRASDTMPADTSRIPEGRAAPRAGPDWLRRGIWLGAAVLVLAALAVAPGRLRPAAGTTLVPFATLAGVVASGLVADRAGLFRLAARLLVPPWATNRMAVAGTLLLTALVSGLVNLDVAVVVAVPFGLEAARRRGLRGDRLVASIALTANATSFLLPTSNLTTLLAMGRAPTMAGDYLASSWPAWLLVTALTVGVLTALQPAARESSPSAAGGSERRPGLGALVDLLPLLAAATSIRALLGGGVTLAGGTLRRLAGASLLAAVVDNLPAAASLHPSAAGIPWAAVLGLALGPDLVLTGSLATLISRRLARDRGAGFSAGWFMALGWVLLPAQVALAVAGLHLSGAL
jgi:Na+/H+ antiporter NhaD/arsenite permease-like protein